MTTERAIVLLSGGLDSSLACLVERQKGREVTPLFIDYGQYPVEKERQSAKEFVRTQGLGPLIEMKIQLGTERPIARSWGRTITLVGIACMWAGEQSIRYHTICTGGHEGDIGGDCKPGDFDKYLNLALSLSTRSTFSFDLPIRHYTTEMVGQGLVNYQVDFRLLYNCYWDLPCGFKSEKDTYRCPGCRRKVIAMKAAGIQDEELLAFPNKGLGGRVDQGSVSEEVTTQFFGRNSGVSR